MGCVALILLTVALLLDAASAQWTQLVGTPVYDAAMAISVLGDAVSAWKHSRPHAPRARAGLLRRRHQRDAAWSSQSRRRGRGALCDAAVRGALARVLAKLTCAAVGRSSSLATRPTERCVGRASSGARPRGLPALIAPHPPSTTRAARPRRMRRWACTRRTLSWSSWAPRGAIWAAPTLAARTCSLRPSTPPPAIRCGRSRLAPRRTTWPPRCPATPRPGASARAMRHACLAPRATPTRLGAQPLRLRLHIGCAL